MSDEEERVVSVQNTETVIYETVCAVCGKKPVLDRPLAPDWAALWQCPDGHGMKLARVGFVPVSVLAAARAELAAARTELDETNAKLQEADAAMYAYQACPVCGGRGHVPAGFYSSLPTTAMSEPCRTCRGACIITAPNPQSEAVAVQLREALEAVAARLENVGLGTTGAACEDVHAIVRAVLSGSPQPEGSER